MKKLIMAALAITAGYALSAQEPVVQKQRTSGTYNAYAIPDQIKIDYQAIYGDPMIATWEPMEGWWHATYKGSDRRFVHVYYPTDAWYLESVPGRDMNYRVALPVINTHVDDAVLNAALDKHGAKLYSITKLKHGYQINLLENGTLTSVSVDDSGNETN